MLAGQTSFVVLVVEDEWLVRNEISSEFNAKGLQVLEAASGEAALDLFGENQIDILFTDIQLKGELSGWDVAEALRASKPDLAVIYTSGNSADRSRQVARGLFFDKPYDTSQIVEACQALLAPSGWRSRRWLSSGDL
jgi:CheY-like chemotaxis protein